MAKWWMAGPSPTAFAMSASSLSYLRNVRLTSPSVTAARPRGPCRDEEIDLTSAHGGVLSTAIMNATGMLFRCNSADYSLDWHPAPRKAFSINLKGAVQVTASDGEARIFGPGDIMLADDMGGKG